MEGGLGSLEEVSESGWWSLGRGVRGSVEGKRKDQLASLGWARCSTG